MIPTEVKQLKKEFLSAQPLKQSIIYHIDSWINHLPHVIELKSIRSFFPGRISRENLMSLAKQANKSGNIQDIRTLFLGTMIWGYGTTGYGPWRTAEMFNTPNFSEIVEKSIQYIAQGEIFNAYNIFSVNRCGPPFFTKYFYFCGYGIGIKNYPLILDTRVWEALRDRIKIDTTEFVKKSTWWYPEGYVRYVDTLHEWAEELGCEAHNIEFVLFQLGGS
jgi:hypothetical protein